MAGASVRLEVQTDQVLREIDRTLARRTLDACRYLEHEVKRVLSGPRHGRRYRKPGTIRAWYTASAPGEPPAQRTGRLRSSIRSRLLARRFLWYIGEVGTDVEYASHLEFGTSRMEPRPFLRPAYERSRAAIREILRGRA
ncbi:MAG: HK97 gp10 family phage protein [Firmicutes bacterium]|nr:HK97 gp10 family phage protein [Bacillota bacterium]